MSIERVKADLERLVAEGQAAQAVVTGIYGRITKLKIYLEIAEAYGDGENMAAMPIPPAKIGRPAGSGSEARKVEAAIEAIKSRAGPISTRDLVGLLRIQGIEIAGKDPVINLSSTLSRSDALKIRRGIGWSLAEWPNDHPPADGELADHIPDGGNKGSAFVLFEDGENESAVTDAAS